MAAAPLLPERQRWAVLYIVSLSQTGLAGRSRASQHPPRLVYVGGIDRVLIFCGGGSQEPICTYSCFLPFGTLFCCGFVDKDRFYDRAPIRSSLQSLRRNSVARNLIPIFCRQDVTSALRRSDVKLIPRGPLHFAACTLGTFEVCKVARTRVHSWCDLIISGLWSGCLAHLKTVA